MLFYNGDSFSIYGGDAGDRTRGLSQAFLQALVDTGADVTILSQEMFNKLLLFAI